MHIVQALLFLAVSFSVLGLTYGYTGWRIIAPYDLGPLATSILWLTVAVFLVMPFAAILLRFSGHSVPGRTVLAWAAYLSLGFFTIVFTLVLARDTVYIVTRSVLFLARLIGNAGADGHAAAICGDFPQKAAIFLRFSNTAILLLSLALIGYGVYGARRTPETVTVDVPIQGLHPGLADLRIVQITDIHAGPTIGRGYVSAIVDRVNALEPDIVAVTGDLADGSPDILRDIIAPLGNIRSRYGLFFVTGNHEYYSGVTAWIAEAERLGMTVLTNDHRIIDHGGARLALCGIPDNEGGRFLESHAPDPAGTLLGAGEADMSILLAHQPVSVFEASKAGFDLQISGHTHGGQYMPFKWLVRLQQPYISGLVRHGGTWLYVSRGTGYWGPPVRIGVPSEITLFNIIPSVKN